MPRSAGEREARQMPSKRDGHFAIYSAYILSAATSALPSSLSFSSATHLPCLSTVSPDHLTYTMSLALPDDAFESRPGVPIRRGGLPMIGPFHFHTLLP